MILDIAYYSFGLVLQSFAFVLNGLNFVIPDTVTESIEWMFNYLNYFKGIFPVATLASAFSFVLTVWIGVYLMRLALGIFAMFPFVGSNLEVNMAEKITTARPSNYERMTFRDTKTVSKRKRLWR